MAELWAVVNGLNLTWDYGFRRLQVEVHSIVVLYLLNSNMESTHPYYNSF